MTASHVNVGLNLVLVAAVGAVGWFTKEEILENRHSRETVAKIELNMVELQNTVKDFKDQLSRLVTFSAFTSALQERDTEIQELKKEVRDLRARLPRPAPLVPPKDIK